MEKDIPLPSTLSGPPAVHFGGGELLDNPMFWLHGCDSNHREGHENCLSGSIDFCKRKVFPEVCPPRKKTQLKVKLFQNLLHVSIKMNIGHMVQEFKSYKEEICRCGQCLAFIKYRKQSFLGKESL